MGNERSGLFGMIHHPGREFQDENIFFAVIAYVHSDPFFLGKTLRFGPLADLLHTRLVRHECQRSHVALPFVLYSRRPYAELPPQQVNRERRRNGEQINFSLTARDQRRIAKVCSVAQHR